MQKFATAISEVFSPFLLAGFLVVLIAVSTDPHPALPAALALGFITAIPQGLSIELARRGKTTDRFIQVRQQRTSFYLATLASMLTGAVLINMLGTSYEVKLSLNLSVAMLIVVMLVNLKIKVSVHALLAALFGILAPFYLGEHALLWVAGAGMWALTVWSRLYLKRHSAPELLLGTIFGVGLAILYLILRAGQA